MSEKLGLFDILNNIFEKKGGVLEPDHLRDYHPYIINKALSFHKDLIHFANEMNSLYNIDKDMHYEFLFFGVPKKRRYAKWHKNEDEKNDIELIQEYYGYSYHRAKEVLPLLKGKVGKIREQLEKGGKRK